MVMLAHSSSSVTRNISPQFTAMNLNRACPSFPNNRVRFPAISVFGTRLRRLLLVLPKDHLVRCPKLCWFLCSWLPSQNKRPFELWPRLDRRNTSMNALAACPSHSYDPRNNMSFTKTFSEKGQPCLVK